MGSNERPQSKGAISFKERNNQEVKADMITLRNLMRSMLKKNTRSLVEHGLWTKNRWAEFGGFGLHLRSGEKMRNQIQFSQLKLTKRSILLRLNVLNRKVSVLRDHVSIVISRKRQRYQEDDLIITHSVCLVWGLGLLCLLLPRNKTKFTREFQRCTFLVTYLFDFMA